jgi:hypothetical protein
MSRTEDGTRRRERPDIGLQPTAAGAMPAAAAEAAR